MIKIEEKAGHGAGKPTSKIIEDVADIYSFVSLVLNLTWTDWNIKFNINLNSY